MSPKIVTEFREGLARGELLVQKCSDCSKLNMYPRHACPFCHSLTLGWQRSAGRGILHSFTVLRTGAPQGFEQELPYALGVVKLDEGVQMLARLIADPDGDWRSFKCDDVVQFQPSPSDLAERRPCPWFGHPA